MVTTDNGLTILLVVTIPSSRGPDEKLGDLAARVQSTPVLSECRGKRFPAENDALLCAFSLRVEFRQIWVGNIQSFFALIL